MTAYTAANRVMDTFVQNKSQQNGVAWFSVNWDDWDFNYTKEQTASYKHTTAQFAMSPAEGIDTLERIVSHPAVAQILIKTRLLQPRIEQWLLQKSSDRVSPLQEKNPSNSNDSVATLSDEPNNLIASYGNDTTALLTTLEKNILETFREVLAAPNMTAADNFFDWGGDSLLAAQLLLKLRRTLTQHTQKLSLDALFNHPSAKELTLLLVH